MKFPTTLNGVVHSSLLPKNLAHNLVLKAAIPRKLHLQKIQKTTKNIYFVSSGPKNKKTAVF